VFAADYEWRTRSFERRPNEFRVAVWNAAGRPSGWTPKTGLPINWLPTTEEIGSWKADLIGLVECGDGANTSAASWESRFPGFAVEHQGTGLVLLVRGRVLDRGEIPCGSGSRAAWYDVEIDGQELRFVLVDIASSMRIPRTETIAALSAAVSGWSDRAILLAGDFNLPLESRCLDRLRQAGFEEAFEAAGTGYAPTWPVPIPMLTLDQLWGNSRISFRNCRRGWTQRSDHRPVFVEATIDRPAADVMTPEN
jgi:endonuclease/exonuclease/phosphatase (EEP) superfamily protein YafD